MSLGTGANSRFKAVKEVSTRQPKNYQAERDNTGRELRISEIYGRNVFDQRRMKEKLPKEVYNKLTATIETGKKLDLDIANAVAQAAKEWAISNGVTHFTHWFQPQTGTTAEKHDSFINIEDDKSVIEKFSGGQLIQSEPDASSFPSGGMRATFEARGYTAWDPTSPMFITEAGGGKTLCIPSVFISYHGDALDEKTGLIRSTEILSQKACDLLHLIGDAEVKRVIPTLGAEQEYFLIDRAFYVLRPDLQMTGRSLLGKGAPKGQQLEDHYFGSVPPRVQAYMIEVEQELYKLGVPVKTRHNEVAPNQFEAAPIFEEVNVATDHNQLLMEVLRRVARRHHFEVLLHEKPFAGVNGSGKHCNWSMSVTASGSKYDGLNLLDPGKTPHQNLRFLTVLVGVLKGVHKHAGLLRAGIASAGNDHRLGANEAPPAIMSAFLGAQLNRILDEIEKGVEFSNPEGVFLKLGVSKLPELLRDNTDRNRTSPFAFTGNKFEFRAVGSSASISFPVTLVNTAVAEGFQELSDLIRTKMKSVKNQDQAILEVLRDVIKETKAIRFEGNNYSEEWVKEAEKRGMPNLRKTPEALQQMVTERSKKTITGLKVFSEEELISRYHVRTEVYVKKLFIEVETLMMMVDTQILPAVISYHTALSASVASAKAAGVNAPAMGLLNKITQTLTLLQTKREELDAKFSRVKANHNEEERAKMLAYEVADSMNEVRAACDELEGLVADDLWPLPKYREMLLMN